MTDKPPKINSILDITQALDEDDSIVSWNLMEINPVSGAQYNNPGNITVNVNNSDDFYHPAYSWLEVEGQLVKTNGNVYRADELISFVNYGILFLFDQMKYCLNNTPIDTVFNPGFIANVFSLATNPENFKAGLLECYAPDSNLLVTDDNLGFKARRSLILTSEPDPSGIFRFSVPLKRFFGFCDDYEQVMYGFAHNFIMTRSSTDNNALVHTEWADHAQRAGGEIYAGKVVLSNIRWILPRITPEVIAGMTLSKLVKDRKTLECGFRMRQHISLAVPESNTFTWRLGVRSSPEQPRYIFLAFQSDKMEDQSCNNAVYDHCNLTNAHILLNNERYPLNDFTTNFRRNYFTYFYNEFIGFKKKFYGIDPAVSSVYVGPMDFKDRYPIFVFDVSKQSERLKSGVTDITLQCRFGANVPANTVAHVMMISDRKLKFQSDGEKLSVIF